MSLDATFQAPARPSTRIQAYQMAWFIALLFYFVEYLVRSAPAVMTPELRAAFHVSRESRRAT